MPKTPVSTDLVSVIMPAYNAAGHIAESIESVRVQTYPNWELIVIDDGSTDNTCALVEHYRTLDSRIKYIYQENGRQGKARNNGLAHVSGEYVAFLDSDDLWLPEKLVFQLKQLQQTKADLVFSDCYLFSDKFIPASSVRAQIAAGEYSGDQGIAAFIEVNRIPILTVLARRTAIAEAGGFSEDPLIQNAEDYHLWLKMLLSGSKMVCASTALGAYRQHAASVSDASGQNLRQVVEVKVALAAAYPEKKELLLTGLQQTLLASLEQVAKFSDLMFYATLDRYLQITHRYSLRIIFAGLRKLKARRLALKSMYFVLNYM